MFKFTVMVAATEEMATAKAAIENFMLNEWNWYKISFFF